MRSLVTVALLLAGTLMAGEKEERTWNELSGLVNRQIRLMTPGGAVIQGTMTALEADGLVMQIRSTSDKKAFPKGRYVAPRAEVKTVDVVTKGRKYRTIGTIVGVWSGLALGIFAGAHMDSGGAALTIFGLVGGGMTTAGYFIGDAADTHTMTIVVKP